MNESIELDDITCRLIEKWQIHANELKKEFRWSRLKTKTIYHKPYTRKLNRASYIARLGWCTRKTFFEIKGIPEFFPDGISINNALEIGTKAHFLIPKIFSGHGFFESKYKDYEYRITGHTDAIIPSTDPDTQYIGLEFKTKFHYQKNTPFLTDKYQIAIYSHLTGIKQWFLIYLNKTLPYSPEPEIFPKLIKRFNKCICTSKTPPQLPNITIPQHEHPNGYKFLNIRSRCKYCGYHYICKKEPFNTKKNNIEWKIWNTN